MRTRANYNLRLNEEERALLAQAARLAGFSGWSAYVRHVATMAARQTLLEHGGVQRAPDPDAPTLWDAAP